MLCTESAHYGKNGKFRVLEGAPKAPEGVLKAPKGVPKAPETKRL